MREKLPKGHGLVKWHHLVQPGTLGIRIWDEHTLRSDLTSNQRMRRRRADRRQCKACNCPPEPGHMMCRDHLDMHRAVNARSRALAEQRCREKWGCSLYMWKRMQPFPKMWAAYLKCKLGASVI